MAEEVGSGWSPGEWLALAGGALVLLIVIGSMLPTGPSKEQEAKAAVAREEIVRKQAEAREVAQAKVSQANAGAAADKAAFAIATRQIEAVLSAYDKLPVSRRTMIALRDAMAENLATIERAPVATRPALVRVAQAGTRRRYAPLLTPGASSYGAEADRFVPSPDHDTCFNVGETIADDPPESLTTVGFVGVYCAGKTKKSEATGKLVEIPSGSWDF